MSVNQALAAALSGVNVTQQALAVISGNVANANTPGYVAQKLSTSEIATSGTPGSSVQSDGVSRELSTLLQGQLWTETSGGSYADTAAQMYQQLQSLYGTPGASTSIDGIFNSLTAALQTLSTSPSSYSAQAGVISAAQAVAQNLNSMTTGIQELRTQAEQGIATDIATVNTALQQIAKINGELEGASIDSSAAALEDQRDQAITQITQLMNVRVVQGPNDQVSLFTGTGQQLVAGVQASQLQFTNAGTLSATALWSADPSRDGAGTISLVSPGGSTTDLVANNAIQSGEIGAYLQMRDSILPQAQTQLDELANQMAQALSNQTTSGTPVSVGGQSGFQVDIGNLLAGNSVNVTYTDAANTQRTVTIVALGPGGSIPTSSSGTGNQVIGVDLSGGISAVVSQLNAALGSKLQFSNPSGSVLQVVNVSGSGNTVTSLSATSTVTALSGSGVQIPLFLDGSQPITGALSTGGSQTVGLAGTITVNPALVSSPSSLVAYSATTGAGDATRPNFILSQLTTAALTYSPATGIGSSQQPYSGTLGNYISAVMSQQSQAANAATNLQTGQDAVVTALQQKFNDQSGVNIDTELSNLIALQNAYGANARVMTTIQQMMQTLLQIGA